MTTDTYSIQVAVDSTSAVTATRNLTAMEQATGRSERALSSLGNVAKIAGSALAGISIASMAKDILRVNMEFESLRTSLETVTGSAKNAKIAFEGIQQFAAKTPYSVKEVTDAFIKMKALGLSPSEKALTSYGNTASAMGKSLKQMVEAVADAATGEFERLKEFGIKASKQGDDIKFTFKGVETKVKDSSTAITAYLQKLGDTDFAGGMERQGQTMKGTLSSLADAWDNFIDHILNDKSGGAISRWITSATSSLGKFDVWLNGATTSIGKLAELQQEQNRLQASINAHNQNGVIGSLIDDLSGFDASGKQSKLAKNIEEQKRLRKELEDEKKVMVDITKAAPVSKIDEPDKKAAAKAAAEAKRAQAQATKELALAEKDYNEQINMQVATAENAGKLFAAQQQTKIAALEAERVSISDKAAIEYESAKTYEEKSRILNESQSATNLLLAKEKEIRDSLTNQSAETIDAKIAAAQAELDNAGKYNLTLAEQLRLKTEIAGLQTDKAVLAETSTQSDIKAKSDAEQKYNDDKLASIKAISDAQTAANTAASAQMDILTANLETAKEAATGLADAFGSVGGAVGGLGVALASYEKSQAAITDGLQNQLFEIQKLNDGKGDQAKADKAIATASQKQSQLQVKSYGDMAAAAQGFFKKGTAGYNALGVATKVFRAFEMAQSAMSMAKMVADIGTKVGAYVTGILTQTSANAASVAPNVTADGIKATAAGTEAVAKASAAPFPIGFATGAAMLAFMLAIGVAMAGGGSSAPQMSGADYQKAQSEKYTETIGGTVLGSSDASKSIINALDIISANSTADLDYSKGMAESLQKLTYSIDNVTASVAQQMDFGRNGVSLAGSSKTTGVFGSAGGGISGIGITAAINMVLPIVGLIMGAFTTVTKITKQFAGSGFKFMDELYSSVVKNGTTSVQQYIDILVTETKSSFFGLVSSSKQWITTKYKPIEERVKEAFTDTILGIGNSIIKTADLLGQNTATLTDQVNNFNVELGRIPMERTNYKGKGSRQKNQENATINEERLNAAFEKLSDKMAMLSPQFLESQKIQEGYYQTLMRVTVAISTANTKLKAMGINAIEYSDIVEKRGDIEKQMIVQSLQLASEFTDVNDIIGKLPGTADDIIEAFNGLNSIKAGLAAIGASGLTLSQDLINVAGGISALNNTINDYFNSDYFTKSEKTAFNVKTLTDKFSDLGLLMPTIGVSTELAMASYRSLLEVLAKDTTDQGKLIYLKALEMSGDFATAAQDIADIVKSETETATKSFNDAMDYRIAIYKKLGEQDPAAKEEALRLEREKSMQGMTGLTLLYAGSLNTLTDASAALTTSQTALETAYKNLTTMRDKFISLGQGIRTYYDQLTGAQKPQATALEVYSSAKESFITTALDAKLGKESALSTLPEVSKAFLEASLKYNATGNAYQADYQSVLTALEQGMSAADKQIEIMNLQLREAEKANTNLLTVNSSTLTVNTATTNLATALAGYQKTLIDYNSAKTTADQILVGINSILKAQDLKTQAEKDAAIAAAKTNQDALIAQAQADANKIVAAAQQSADNAASAAKTAQDAATKIANDAAKASADAAANSAAVLKAAQDLAAKNLSDAQAKAKADADKAAAELKAAKEAADYQKALKDALLNVTTQSGLSTATITTLSEKTLLGMSKLLDNVDKKYDVAGVTQKDFPSINLAKSLEIAMSGSITGELSKLTNTQLESLATKSGYDQKQLFDLYSAYSLGYKYGSPEQKILYPGIPAYANGGMASGLSLVGEQGAELINFTSPANVTSHQQTNGLFDSIGNAIDDQSVLLKEQIIELKALVNLQSSANIALINEMQGMKEELSTISRKAKLEAAA
jgi:hypothetical protein